jgi:hypothetical protein
MCVATCWDRSVVLVPGTSILAVAGFLGTGFSLDQQFKSFDALTGRSLYTHALDRLSLHR